MIVQFSINPMDSEHISTDVQKITSHLEQRKIKYWVGPIGTSIQGEWNEIMPVIQECHQMIAGNHARVLTNIIIDDHKGNEHDIEESIAMS